MNSNNEMENTTIEIDGGILKVKDNNFTNKEREQFWKDFIDWIEDKDLMFIGVIK